MDLNPNVADIAESCPAHQEDISAQIYILKDTQILAFVCDTWKSDRHLEYNGLEVGECANKMMVDSSNYSQSQFCN
ncbi:hypothetical protein scyTo_0015832 [Scyliorhinus torazame]|uniref:Uncharacterized protein n=1 Tax=Scyliorhinus torazame TaxID=75743 RepID=A0A401PZA6_SCYTO|nr:hypothetical protein [Scyliorhinus torazame]